MVGIVFAVLSALGLFLVANVQIQPEGASREAEIVDDAVELLLFLSVPVFAFVTAVLAYVALRFRAGDNDGDAEPVRTNRDDGLSVGRDGSEAWRAVFTVFVSTRSERRGRSEELRRR